MVSRRFNIKTKQIIPVLLPEDNIAMQGNKLLQVESMNKEKDILNQLIVQ